MKYILILEDNIKTLNVLEKMVRGIRDDIVTFPVQTYEAACMTAMLHPIDVFLLDIVLTTAYPGDTSGIKFAEKIRKQSNYLFTPIIFITALADPELYAYRDLHCFGYLEKPFSIARAKELVKKALQYKSPIENNKKIYLRKEGILFAIPLQEVMYVEAKNHILMIYMKEEMLEIPYITIKKFLKEASYQKFFQCSRNTVINKDYIKNIDMANRYISLTASPTLLEIGPTFYKKFIKELKYG